MRWLAVHPGPHFSVHDVYRGWVAGLRACGQQVAEYNLGDRLNAYGYALMETGKGPGNTVQVRKMYTNEQTVELATNGIYAALYKVKPDVLLIVSGFFVPPELLDMARANGTAVIIVHTESPYEDDRQLALAEHADLNLLNDPINIERYLDVGPALYVPHAYDPAIHRPGAVTPQLASDFAFVGTGFASRIAFFEQLDFADADVLLAGNWGQLGEESPLSKYVAHDIAECMDNAKTAEVYRSAKVSLNLYRREAQRIELGDGLAMGPREVEMAACGLFFLRDPRPEGDSVFPMLPTFTSPAEASYLIRWWLDHDDARQRAADAAREAIADRTFANHAAALLRRIVKE